MTRTRDIVLTREQLELKQASKKLVRAVGGTDGAAASLTSEQRSVRQQRVSDCTLPNTLDFLRIDEAAELEELSHGQPGWPHVTRVMAARQGFVLVQLPPAQFDSSIWTRRVAELLTDVGELSKGIGERLQNDGDIDPDEAASELPTADKLVEAAIEAREALRRRAAGEF